MQFLVIVSITKNETRHTQYPWGFPENLYARDNISTETLPHIPAKVVENLSVLFLLFIRKLC